MASELAVMNEISQKILPQKELRAGEKQLIAFIAFQFV